MTVWVGRCRSTISAGMPIFHFSLLERPHVAAGGGRLGVESRSISAEETNSMVAKSVELSRGRKRFNRSSGGGSPV
jgi:hypothetical protein